MNIKRTKNRQKRGREMLMRKIQIRSQPKGQELTLIIILLFPKVMNGNMKEKCLGQKYPQSLKLMLTLKLITKTKKSIQYKWWDSLILSKPYKAKRSNHWLQEKVKNILL
jgi:hypothetical protein